MLAIHVNKGWSRNATGAIIAKLTYRTTALWLMADGRYGYTYVQSGARGQFSFEVRRFARLC